MIIYKILLGTIWSKNNNITMSNNIIDDKEELLKLLKEYNINESDYKKEYIEIKINNDLLKKCDIVYEAFTNIYRARYDEKYLEWGIGKYDLTEYRGYSAFFKTEKAAKKAIYEYIELVQSEIYNKIIKPW
jgi:hypothetical protein